MTRGNAIHKLAAPRCSYPECNNRVRYHKKSQKDDGSYSYQWKTFCEYHRGQGKAAVEEFKKIKGCESHKVGWECPGNHGELTIDHFDGNKHNVDESNIVVLCPNCHQKKTRLYGDCNNRYYNRADLNGPLWDVGE